MGFVRRRPLKNWTRAEPVKYNILCCLYSTNIDLSTFVGWVLAERQPDVSGWTKQGHILAFILVKIFLFIFFLFCTCVQCVHACMCCVWVHVCVCVLHVGVYEGICMHKCGCLTLVSGVFFCCVPFSLLKKGLWPNMVPAILGSLASQFAPRGFRGLPPKRWDYRSFLDCSALTGMLKVLPPVPTLVTQVLYYLAISPMRFLLMSEYTVLWKHAGNLWSSIPGFSYHRSKGSKEEHWLMQRGHSQTLLDVAGNRILCSPGWPLTQCVAEVSYELLILLPPPATCWNDRSVQPSQADTSFKPKGAAPRPQHKWALSS